MNCQLVLICFRFIQDHVERDRRLQDSFHTVDGWPVFASDSGAGANVAPGHPTHFLRHARLRAPTSRQLQTGRVRTD